MLSEDQIKQQIYQFLKGKDLDDRQRAGFMVAAMAVVRQKFALEVEESLSSADAAEIEKIPDDKKAMEEMVNRWQKNTGKTTEARLQEIILDFFEKFLAVK